MKSGLVFIMCYMQRTCTTEYKSDHLLSHKTSFDIYHIRTFYSGGCIPEVIREVYLVPKPLAFTARTNMVGHGIEFRDIILALLGHAAIT